jgi:hypothetical protein
MPAQRSYLQQRQHERRWRVITGLVVAGALAAAAVWTLERHATQPDGTLAVTAGAATAPAAGRLATGTALR